MGKKLCVHAISELELYKFAPWDLPEKSCLRSKDLEWFFFCPRDKKYPKGSRTNRATPNGYWKTSGKDRTIELNSRTVGLKKTLIFHEGKAPKGNRTDWVMYEYRMEDDNLVSAGFSKDEYVLCKIFKKSGLGPRIGEQYGAPFDEDDWENLSFETSAFGLVSSEIEDPQAETSVIATATVTQEPPHQLVRFSGDVNICTNEVNTASVSLSDLEGPHVEASVLATAAVFEEQPIHSQQSAQCSEHVDTSSSEFNNAPPEDGIFWDELSKFLDNSPHRDIPFGEESGLPPMSELEAQAFEINTADLYNELAGLAGSGGLPIVDFGAIDVGFSLNNFQHTSSEQAVGDDYLELDDLLARDATLSYELPTPNNEFLQYPLNQSSYGGHYHDGATLSSAFAASGSIPPMPCFFGDVPAVPNNLVNPNYSDSSHSTLKDSFF